MSQRVQAPQYHAVSSLASASATGGLLPARFSARKSAQGQRAVGYTACPLIGASQNFGSGRDNSAHSTDSACCAKYGSGRRGTGFRVDTTSGPLGPLEISRRKLQHFVLSTLFTPPPFHARSCGIYLHETKCLQRAPRMREYPTPSASRGMYQKSKGEYGEI